jgi:hypothetical protein
MPVNQTLPLKIFQEVGEGLGADPIEAPHHVFEPDFFMVPDDGDHQDGPFLRDGVDDSFEWAQADPFTI